jgi:hypothetical protein
MTIEERISALKSKLEEYRALYFKCEGAIEILTEMANEKPEDK